MSPLRVLSRGYAVATKGARGAVVTDAAALKEGTRCTSDLQKARQTAA